MKQSRYRDGILGYRPRFPIALCANVHTYCNQACVMCPHPRLAKEQPQMEMGWEPYTRLLDDFVSGGGRLLTFNNFSEIFALEKGVEYVVHALRRPELDVYLVTNGLFLTPEVSDRLLAEGFAGMVFVSCHGFSEGTFAQITSRHGFSRVKENIEYFLRSSPCPGKTVVQFMQDLVPRSEVELAKRHWQGLGASFNEITSHTFCESSSHKKMSAHPSEGALIGCRSWDLDAGLPFYQMVVQPDGEVTLCCMDVAREIRLGNVFSSNIASVWNGEAFKAVVEKIYSGETLAGEDFVCNRCPSAYYELQAKPLLPWRVIELRVLNQLSKWI